MTATNGWPTCPVCKLGHRPARYTSGGPPRCYHCGHAGRRCKCYPTYWDFVKRIAKEVAAWPEWKFGTRRRSR